MNTDITLEQLLKWRLSHAEAGAPPSPRAARLLEAARPWWETFPERYRALVERLVGMRVAFGHAMADPRHAGGDQPVPALLAGVEGEIESSALVLYLSVRENRLRFRFRLHPQPAVSESALDLTLIADKTTEPVGSTRAELSADGDYRVDVELPEEVARKWERLKVTDRMPFRLILRVGSGHA